MIQIVSNYTCEIAKKLFESAGLSVLFTEVEIDFDIASGKILLPVCVVINPYNQQPELLDVAFRRYMETTFKPDILNDNKLNIINSFKTQKP